MIVAAVLLAALGAVLCVFPLFNLLGYESAALTGACVGIFTLLHTAWRFDRREILPPLDRTRRGGPLLDYFLLLPSHLALLLAPALILSLNALRVPNCDFQTGLAFWLLIPTGSVVLGLALAFAVAVLPRLRVLAAAGLLALEVAHFFWRFAWQPPITGHEWFIGYFSGSIYDEALALPTSLLWYRLLCLALACALLLGLEVAWRWRTGRLHLPYSLGLLLALAVLLALHTHRFALDISVNKSDAIALLGGRLETEHFIIYFDPADIDAQEQRLLAEDHEFHYDRLRRVLEVDPVAGGGGKLGSFVYPSLDVQKRLLGSRNTLVARPWTREMHIRWEGYGQGALGHELAHLFSASFGGGPFVLATRDGLLPDIGMIEGLAEAADWPAEELPLHQAAAAMRRLEMAPNLRHIFHPAGFWSQPSRRAYTLMGSFVRYLLETYGVAPLREAYGYGDFRAAYGRSVGDLITEWESFVDALPLTEQQVELAAYLYRRGSIFERICARTMAELQRTASLAERRGDLAGALEIWAEIIGHEPQSEAHRLSRAQLLADAGQPAAALQEVEMVLGWELSPAQRARALELGGDLAWKAGSPAQAAARYAEAMQASLPQANQRRLWVKWTAVRRWPAAGDWPQRYLLENTDRAHRLYAALQWAQMAPAADPLPAYLVGLQLHAMGEYGEASRWFRRADGLPEPALAEQRDLLLAESLLLSDQLSSAEAVYRSLAAGSSERLRLEVEEGLARIAFRRSL